MPVPLGGDTGIAVHPASDVGTVPVLELDHRLDHRLRGEPGGGIVKVDDLSKDREVLSDLVNGEGFAIRSLSFWFHGTLSYRSRGLFLPGNGLQGEIFVEGDPPAPAELPHLGRECLPAPEAPSPELFGEPFLPGPPVEECIPPGSLFRVQGSEYFVLALKHRRADHASDPFDPLLVEGVDGGVLPPEVEEYLQRPPVPDRRDIQLQGICRVLAGLIEVSPVPGLVPAVPLDREAGAGRLKVDLQGVELLQLAAPAVIFARRPGLLGRLPEVTGLPDHLHPERFDKRHCLWELDASVEEECLFNTGFPRKEQCGHAVFAAREGDIDTGPVMEVPFYGADRVPLQVLQVVLVLPDGRVPVRVGGCFRRHRHHLFDPDEPFFHDTGPEPVLVGDDNGPLLCRLFQAEPFSPDPSALRAEIGIGLEADHPAGGMRNEIRKCFRGDIEAEPAAHRVKGQPGVPVPVHDHEIGPVDPAGLVQEDDLRQRDGTEPIGEEGADQIPVSSKGGTDIIRLQKGECLALDSAGTAATDERHIALFAPVQDFFDGRLPHFHRIMCRTKT